MHPDKSPRYINQMSAELAQLLERTQKAGFDGGGGGGYDSDMEERVENLEKLVEKTVDRVVSIERDVAVMRSNYATGKDVSDAKSTIIMWVVAAIFLAQLLPMVKEFLRPGGVHAAVMAPEIQPAAPEGRTK